MAKKAKSKKTKSKKTKGKSSAKLTALVKDVEELKKDNRHNKALWNHLMGWGRSRIEKKKPYKNAFDLPVSKALSWATPYKGKQLGSGKE